MGCPFPLKQKNDPSHSKDRKININLNFFKGDSEKMIKKCLLSTAILSTLLLTSGAYASSCSLNGVDFDGLSSEQQQALANVGAACVQSDTSGFKYAEEGYYIINGEKHEAIDIAANDPYDMDGVEATFYGYIGFMLSETPRHEIWGYRFDTSMNAGEIQKMGSSSYVNYANVDIPLLFVADQYNDTVESAKADRIKFYKALNKAKSLEAAVKVTGTFRVFSNTGDLYMRGADIEIIETKS